MKTIQRLAFVVVATIVCLSASAIDIKLKKDKTVVDGITFAINAKKQVAQVVRGEEPYVGDIVIPEKITVDSVVCYVEEIASNGFKDCPGVTSIVIPNCITKIGSSAFQGCSSIAEITIPSRIQELPTSLFENCTSLTTVKFEGSVKKLGNNIFEGCKSLVDFPAYRSEQHCQRRLQRLHHAEGGAHPLGCDHHLGQHVQGLRGTEARRHFEFGTQD